MENFDLDIRTENDKYLIVSVKDLENKCKEFDKFIYLEKTGIVSENINITNIPEDVGYDEYEKFYMIPGYSIYGANHKSNEIKWLATIYRRNSHSETEQK